MLNEEYKKLKENIPLLRPYLAGSSSLEQDVQVIGQFLEGFFPIRMVMLFQISNGKDITADNMAVFSPSFYQEAEEISSSLNTEISHLVPLLQKKGSIGGTELRTILKDRAEDAGILQQIHYLGSFCGFLFVQREGSQWHSGNQELVKSLSEVMGASFAARISGQQEKLSNFVMNTVLDGMKASIYITDLNTDKILFMNQAMKNSFGLEHPEGHVCWQVMQKGMSERCRFCPIKELQKNPESKIVYQWDEVNTVTGRSYHNYDSLIKWVDGSVVHLQQSIDMTEINSANTDELTQLLTRRPGKSALHDMLEEARNSNKIATVCMFDINNLKKVNDNFGHAEGDRLISAVARGVRVSLHESEFAFRLSGDEFIAVFWSSQKDVRKRMDKVLQDLQEQNPQYKVGFCYGTIEVSRQQPLTDEEAMFLSDERMYEQKRRYHIMCNERRRRKSQGAAYKIYFDFDREYLYDALVQSTEDYLYVCNMQTGLFRYSRAMVEEFELPGEVIENAAAVWGAKVHPDDRQTFLEANQEITDGRTTCHCVEYRAKNRRGEWVWVRCRGHLELDEYGNPILFAGFISNLGKKNKIEHLTGLYNKLEFEEQVHYLMESAPDNSFGIMKLGIDELKNINELYDRAFGDDVIRIVAQRLLSMLPADNFLYRLDGDEFGIIARDTAPDSMGEYFKKIQHSFARQQEHDGKKYYCTLSAGCLFYPTDGKNFQNLLKYADYALEFAKNHGKNCCTFFSSEIMGYRSRMLEMIEALRESMENEFEGFSLRYQPLVVAGSGKLNGVEALARWRHEKFGDVSPVEFIPLLEQTGMIIPVGKWVLQNALHTSKDWCCDIDNFVVDVNLSYFQIEGSDFVTFMQKVLEEEKFPPRNLVLELTESYFAQEDQRAQEIFAKIRSLGVRIAMDDFGTGYSSLGTLKVSPADIVKIDRTFMKDILTSRFDATFIRFVVELCHDVGIEVCLEGVETEEEYQAVSSMGLDMIQGFLFDMPLTKEDFYEKYLRH